jgi:alkylhydroperoxidase family enzyme
MPEASASAGDGHAEPRIAPLPVEERDQATNDMLDKVGPGRDLNLFTTLVRHQRLFRRWLPLCGGLLSGKLSPRDRELLILRTADRCGAAYEWAHHLVFAADAGLTSEEVARVRAGADADGWTELESALVRSADELHDECEISASTWSVLSAHYDQEQLIEVPMVVGHYHMVAFAARSFGVTIEPAYQAHPAAHGAD